jgi:hypothetical protein
MNQLEMPQQQLQFTRDFFEQIQEQQGSRAA